MNYWDQIRNYLKSKVHAESYENWLRSARFQAMDGNILLVAVPDRETLDWLETEYAMLIARAIDELRLPVDRLVYVVAPERGSAQLATSCIRKMPQGRQPSATPE